MSYGWQSTTTLTPGIVPVYQAVLDKVSTPFVFDQMVDEVCQLFNVQRSLVFNKCKKTDVKFARWFIWSIMTSHGYHPKQCGLIVGDHERTTVIHALDTIDHDLQTNEELNQKWEQVKKYMKSNN